MATIKSYTSLEQSKKLAEILPPESADMCYKCIEDVPYDVICRPYSSWKKEYIGLLVRGDANAIPCWSLAALLDVLPSATLDSSDDHHFRLRCMEKFTEWHDNAIDTCVEMIEKLLKQMIYDFNNS